MQKSYLDFELTIRSGGGSSGHEVEVRSTGGEEKGTLGSLPELRSSGLVPARSVEAGKATREVTRPLEPGVFPSTEQAAKDLGASLFRALFPPPILTLYRVCQERARREEKGLRIRLRIEAPELASVPWELLYDETTREHLARSGLTPLTRYISLPVGIEALKIEPPIQILGLSASPNGLTPIQEAAERDRLQAAVLESGVRDRLHLTWLSAATFEDLCDALSRRPCHILHFAGHGGFDADRSEGFIVLCDNGEPQRLFAGELALLLGDSPATRLVVLNCCDGALGSRAGLLSSTAATLVARGIPAVVAMQRPIADDAAMKLAQVFYGEIARSHPIDQALSESRKQLRGDRYGLEWAVPVLYLRSPDGRLFDMESPVQPSGLDKPPPPPPGSAGDWCDVAVVRDSDVLTLTTRSSRQSAPSAHVAAIEGGDGALTAFAAAVRACAEEARPLGKALLERARELGAKLFGPVPVGGAAGSRSLLRLILGDDPLLRAVPWELIVRGEGPSAGRSHVLVCRGLRSKQACYPRDVAGALTVLAVAPGDGEGAALELRKGLSDSIASGAVDWLPPLTGAAATREALLDRLSGSPEPHVIHFLGKGRVDREEAQIGLADPKGGVAWLPAAELAEKIRAHSRGLRLMVLDALEGTEPGSFAAAAEQLAGDGAGGTTGLDAVVAHLWPVSRRIATELSGAFYGAFAHPAATQADAAAALHGAREHVCEELGDLPEAFSPVLVLRGREPAVFDFNRRHLEPLPPPPAMDDGSPTLPSDPRVARLLAKPFSLVLGDRREDDRRRVAAFRQALLDGLALEGEQWPATLPLASISQRFVQRLGQEKMRGVFQDAFGESTYSEEPLLAALARRLPPGVHTTLLRLPMLEYAVAAQQPDRTIYVIEPPGPDEKETKILVRPAGGAKWQSVPSTKPLPDRALESSIALLRLYRGYLPKGFFDDPLITEDDYFLGWRGLGGFLSPDLAPQVQGYLGEHPTLLIGLSLLTAHHRMLLHRLFGGHPLPAGSIAVLDPGSSESGLWKGTASLPGHHGVDVAEVSSEELLQWIST